MGWGVQLDREVVHDLNQQGGSFLGVSRGHPKNEEVIDKLEVRVECASGKKGRGVMWCCCAGVGR